MRNLQFYFNFSHNHSQQFLKFSRFIFSTVIKLILASLKVGHEEAGRRDMKREPMQHQAPGLLYFLECNAQYYIPQCSTIQYFLQCKTPQCTGINCAIHHNTIQSTSLLLTMQCTTIQCNTHNTIHRNVIPFDSILPCIGKYCAIHLNIFRAVQV